MRRRLKPDAVPTMEYRYVGPKGENREITALYLLCVLGSGSCSGFYAGIMRPITLAFPEQLKEGSLTQLTVEETSVVVVGANGAGKSRLGAFIASQNGNQRIAGQRLLNFSESVNPTSFEAALQEHLNAVREASWHSTRVQSDFDSLLRAVVSEEYFVSNKYRLDARASEVRVPPPETILDVIVRTWNKLLPHRQIAAIDGKLLVEFGKPGVFSVKHGASHLSDGEKGVLYLVGQILCFRRDSVIVVDEPELHIHRSILTRLWNELELLRSDCLFVYLTHDLEFAASRHPSKKIWLRDYTIWFDWVEISSVPGISEAVYLEVVGSRHPVLFVEGEMSSLDFQLYSVVYPGAKIRPCGSCERVIAATRSFNSQRDLHRATAAAIVDGDFRDCDEKAAFEAEGIFCLGVSQIENLFLAPEFFKWVADRFCADPKESGEKLDALILSRLNDQLDRIAEAMAVARLERQFSVFPGNHRPKESWEKLRAVSFDDVATACLLELKQILSARDSQAALRVIRQKGLLCEAGGILGMKPKDFAERLIRLIQREHAAARPILERFLPMLRYAEQRASVGS